MSININIQKEMPPINYGEADKKKYNSKLPTGANSPFMHMHNRGKSATETVTEHCTLAHNRKHL